MLKHLGARSTATDTDTYSRSKHWDGKKFKNLEATSMDMGLKKLPKLVYKQFFEKKGRAPQTPLPILPFDKQAFSAPSGSFRFVWYGHSVVLMRLQEKTILIDPMLGDNAAPISPFPIKRFSRNTLQLIQDFPEIDMLLLTHDHYDHLDYGSIQQLKSKVKHYYVALGVGRHLIKWGIPQEKITEFDWWEHRKIDDVEITFTPTRHFSGRGLTDRASSLWGGWALKGKTENIWFSGDGGYGKHFAEIGDKLGPFDFAFMECGQYSENWHHIHMYPEESIQAAIDAGAAALMPVHWAGFALAQHPWQEPVERFVTEAVKRDAKYIVPRLGEVVSDPTKQPKINWAGF